MNGHQEEGLVIKAREWNLEINSLEFARRLDEEDVLRDFRNLFRYPKKKDLPRVELSMLENEEEEAIYFCGNSLGLQLKSIENHLHKVLNNWAERGVHSHSDGYLPAARCEFPLKEKMAKLVGANSDEVAIMSSLTVNIHVMMASFYKPTPDRHKILLTGRGFPSDLYAVQGQILLHGYDPDESIIFLNPTQDEYLLNINDVLSLIEEEGQSIALIFLEGVHYYTGQLLNMDLITQYGHKQGCVVGFDLAHAVGNVKLELHHWKVDFAVWCTYKYLNAGAGSMGAIFVHRRFTTGNTCIFPMLRGWWGVNKNKAFEGKKEFEPSEGADRFKVSNASPFLATMILNNLEVFEKAGMDRLNHKQTYLTSYLYRLLDETFSSFDEKGNEVPHLNVITPYNHRQRGSQISFESSIPVDTIQHELEKRGVVCDVRLHSVIRVTPVPLYNTFTEVYKFVKILKEIFSSLSS